MRHHASLTQLCEPGGATLGSMYATDVLRSLPAPLPRGGFIYTGIEIEVENVIAHQVEPEPWRLVPDGSLRNSGMELLSNPIRSHAVLSRYCNAYTRMRDDFPWQDSIRTSTHVHLDSRGLQLPDLVRIVAAYNIVEPILYLHCGPLREENIYCIPFYRADTITHGLIRAVRTGEVTQFLTQTCKYSGLYLGPLRSLGTIEFRMAPSFPSGASVAEWVLMLHHFYNAALALNPQQAHELIDRGEYRELLRQLLPGGLYDRVPGDAELAELIEDHTCDLRAAALYELFLPPKSRKWVMPDMPTVESHHQPGVMERARLNRQHLGREIFLREPSFQHEDEDEEAEPYNEDRDYDEDETDR